MRVKILFFILIIGIFHCKKDTAKTNPYASLLIGQSLYSPQIFSVDPKRGNPPFTTPSSVGFIGASYNATTINIKGKNFIASTTGNTVSINGIQAIVDYAGTDQLTFKVPSGASTGPITVANNGGACSNADRKSGINCDGDDFYIDCYGAFNNQFGSETAVGTGTSQTVTYDSLTTKAFRSDLIFTNPYSTDTAQNTITIRCANFTRVLLFSPSCVPTEYTANGSNIVINPVISINSRFYTIQYLLTATKGDCTIRVN
ncbi:MAG TPA: IPT/TIG domain-containing protein [Leptospiraceae bacterium]|nr:IPT/TIG domain-containing protein [Leptospiraceae bacterium]HMX33659.1 IPT/TIG domain-containing protein [Leptospiraceae bacterium]HMY30212.1 IPT/TIG domain-containing protein [Leptospiraceae bacterium]HNA06539.1 IPT/TIG domain-containing protein [Leptospiraceae bacterium]HNB99397.1 IPT/TIG domain-containing protein [Leptospiraceae bacterium]